MRSFVFLDFKSYLCAEFICLRLSGVSAPNNCCTICFACQQGAFRVVGVIDKWAQRQVWASANKMKIKNMCNQLQAAWGLLINKKVKLWE